MRRVPERRADVLALRWKLPDERRSFVLQRLRESKREAVVAFLAGGVAFAAIWLAGFPEAAFLGFVGAATIWGATMRRRCEPRRARPR
jgi:hypothetical protein